jgi:POT family proton-dependent oligopeptide transporter
MTLGVLWYILDRRYLGDAGSEPTSDPETRAAAYGTATKAGIGILLFIGLLAVLHNTGIFVLSWTGVNEWVGYITLASVALFIGYVAFFTGQSWEQTKKVLAIGLLFVFTALFWSGFEQASTSLNAFARDLTDRTFFGWVMPTEYLQSVNPFFIIVLAPVFGALWIRLAAKNLNPSIPMKFSLGLIQLAAGFLVLMVGAGIAQTNLEDEPNRVSIMWLCTTYLLFTTGELCLSPVGLSTITKLAPREYVSQMMGIWFIAAALGNLIAGRVGGMIEHMPHAQIFRTVAFIVGACGIVMLVFSPLMHRKLMGGVK